MTNRDDQRLLNELRAGHPEACAQLIRAHYKAVYRLLAHLTLNVHEAEDLTQETFATVWEKIATFQGRSTLSTWLHRIAYMKFIDARRSKSRAVTMLNNLGNNATVSPAGPLEAAIADDEAQHLYHALHGLETPERTVLVLHYLQGLSYREMAAVLDEPTGTLKWRTAEALNTLRTLMNHEAPDHGSRETAAPERIC